MRHVKCSVHKPIKCAVCRRVTYVKWPSDDARRDVGRKLYAEVWRLPKRVFTHAANYLLVYTIVIMYRLDAIAANRWLLTNAAIRTHYMFYVCLFVLVLARGQAAVCASPTLKRLVRKYNYSEDVKVNETADDGEANAPPPPARA